MYNVRLVRITILPIVTLHASKSINVDRCKCFPSILLQNVHSPHTLRSHNVCFKRGVKKVIQAVWMQH